MPKHKLSNKDTEALTADCSVCGKGVRIQRSEQQGYACRAARRIARRNFAQAHPDRKRRQRGRRSPHRLSEKDLVLLNAECAICGNVSMVANGNGWMCGNRAAELNLRDLPPAPNPRCPKCLGQFLDHLGNCPLCDKDMAMPMVNADRWRDVGFSIQDGESSLPTGNDSAVPGWKTLGSAERWDAKPVVNPLYAAVYGGRG